MAVLPYLLGVITAPLVGKVARPLFRGVVKASIVVAKEVKKVAAEASEEVQDIAAEVSADKDRVGQSSKAAKV